MHLLNGLIKTIHIIFLIILLNGSSHHLKLFLKMVGLLLFKVTNK